MTTVREVLDRHRNLIGETVASELEAALLEREDGIADQLRLMGAQLGAMPEFVAKALLDVGLGTPPDEETRAFIERGFTTRLEWLQEQFRRQQGGETN
jgi:hypothetical protein